MMLEVVMPTYIRRTKLSERRKPIYYFFDGNSIKTKKGKQPPDKYLKDRYKGTEAVTPTMLKDTYTLVAIRDKKKILISDESQLRYYLLDYRHTVAMYDLTTKQLVLANPGTANTPNYITINGQHIYSGKGGEFTRGSIMDSIKKFYAPFIANLTPIAFNCYPLRIKLYIFDTVNGDTVHRDVEGQRWDVGNRAYPYGKAFLDILANGYNKHNYNIPKIIVDDDRLHVTEDPQGGIFCPIENSKDRKLVFLIGTDDEHFNNSPEFLKLEQTRLNLIKENKYYDRRTNETDYKGFSDSIFEGFER